MTTENGMNCIVSRLQFRLSTLYRRCRIPYRKWCMFGNLLSRLPKLKQTFTPLFYIYNKSELTSRQPFLIEIIFFLFFFLLLLSLFCLHSGSRLLVVIRSLHHHHHRTLLHRPTFLCFGLYWCNRNRSRSTRWLERWGGVSGKGGSWRWGAIG